MQTPDLIVGARVYDNKMKLCRGVPGRNGTEQEQGMNGTRRFLGHCQDQYEKSLAYHSFWSMHGSRVLGHVGLTQVTDFSNL